MVVQQVAGSHVRRHSVVERQWHHRFGRTTGISVTTVRTARRHCYRDHNGAYDWRHAGTAEVPPNYDQGWCHRPDRLNDRDFSVLRTLRRWVPSCRYRYTVAANGLGQIDLYRETPNTDESYQIEVSISRVSKNTNIRVFMDTVLKPV